MGVRLAIAMLLLAVLSGTARAGVDSDLVRAGVAAYDDLEYQKAVDLLGRALKETLTREERQVAWSTLGSALVALEKRDEAQRAFENLLRVNPSYQLDRTISPRVRSVFEAARAAVATGHSDAPVVEAPGLTPEIAPRRPREGEALTVRALHPGGLAERLYLYHRNRGATTYSRIEVPGRDGSFQAVVPGLSVKPPAVEYYLVVLDESGAAVATAGTLGNPLAVDVIARARPVYTKAWFWVVIGGVAAAGAILGGVLAATLPGTPGPNTPATLTIRPQ